MFLVISYDSLNSSSVNLHCMTKNTESANNIYTDLLNQTLVHDRKLIELVEVDEDFSGSYTFYWGQPVPGIKVLHSTNRNF